MPADIQYHAVRYRLPGGKLQTRRVGTAPTGADGKAALVPVKRVLADTHEIAPEQVLVLEIKPLVPDAVVYTADAPPRSAAVVLPTPADIERLNKSQAVALAADLMAAYPGVAIDTDQSGAKLRAELLNVVAQLAGPQAAEATASDEAAAAAQ